MRSPLATIRNRILVGLVLLMLGLVVTAIAGAATLRHMRYAVADELAGLRSSMDVGSGLVTSVLEEIRAAEQYLASPGADARRLFQTTADDACVYERRLDALTGLTAEDRLTVNRLKQLHATIQTEYSIAHALKDLGRDQEAVARAAAVRSQAMELTRRVRDLSRRQAQKAARAAERLTADAVERERKLWAFVVALVVAGVFLSRYTLQSVQGPLARLVTAAERFGAGDLRPVTTGDMPREFRVLADAMQHMGDRLRRIVGEVITEADRIAGSAGDLAAGSGRGGARRRARPRVRRRGRRSPPAGRRIGARGRGGDAHHGPDPRANGGRHGHDGGRSGQSAGHRVRRGRGGARSRRDRRGGGAGGAGGGAGPHGGAVEPRNDGAPAGTGATGVGARDGACERSGAGDGRRGAAGRIDPGDGGRRGEPAAGGRQATRIGAGVPGLGPRIHRRDFFLAGFFFGAGLGL